MGRRIGKTVQGVTTNFVYDGLNPVQEKNGSTVTANLLTGLGIDEFFTHPWAKIEEVAELLVAVIVTGLTGEYDSHRRERPWGAVVESQEL